MQRRAWSSLSWMLPALLALPVGCSKTEGTFVRLEFTGTVTSPTLLRRIDLDLRFAGRTDSASYLAHDRGPIALPIDALLKIRSGEGELLVQALALAADGGVLGAGEGRGTVKRDAIVGISIEFAPLTADAGSDGVLGLDGPPPSIDGALADTHVDMQTLEVARGADGGGGEGGDAGVDTPVADAPHLDTALDTDVAGQRTGGADGHAGAGGASGATGGSSGTDGRASATGDSAAGDSGTDSPAAGYWLSVSPAMLDFGVVLPGAASNEQTLTVTNIGDAATPALTVSISAPPSYPVSSTTCTNAVLGPNDVCTVTLRFTPTASGTIPAYGSVGPAAGATASFQLMGAGASTSPSLALLPLTADFGVVGVNETTALAFTVRNTGTAAAGTITLQVAGSPFFTIAGDDCSDKVLNPQGQCFFGVLFTPTDYGPATATIKAMSSLGLIAAVTASGTGRDTVPVTIDFAGTGSGTVTGTGISCATGYPCTVNLPRTAATDTVTLTATPAAESEFSGWTGQGCSGTGTCTVSLAAPPALTARFTATHYTLSVTRAGTGAGRADVRSTPPGFIDCGSTCSASIKAGQTITLIATAYIGNTFAGWSGACTDTGDCVVGMTAARSVTATFTLEQWQLTVEKQGPGTGTVTSSPAGIDCDPGCTAATGTFDDLTKVTLTATPGAGALFKGWLGPAACPGLTNTCDWTVAANGQLSAIFALPLKCGPSSTKTRTCPLGAMSVDVDLGVMTANQCGPQCGETLNQTPYVTRGCWTLSGGHCYCRDGELVDDESGTTDAGSC